MNDKNYTSDYIEGLHEALREHAAYKECIQFEGDECGECADYTDLIEGEVYNMAYEDDRFAWFLGAALPKERTPEYIARFNVRYTSIVRRFGRDLNEYLLRLALEEAGSSLADENRVPEPITIEDVDRIECGKCAGTGTFSLKTARTSETGETVKAVCFPCGGKGWMTRQDQWRTNTYWAKYARVDA